MLVLSQKPGQKIRLRIGDVVVWVQVVDAGRDKVRLGIEAPREVEILREELLAEAQREGKS
jgi:carbon storage regulator